MPWGPALASIDLSKLVNVTPSVITFGSVSNPVQVKFSFAHGERSTVKERLVIHFRNDCAHDGWITTCLDVLDKGKVPILFSVEQMRNLRMDIEYTPAGEFLARPLFGMQRAALAVSKSNHPVLDIMAPATSS